MEPERKRRKKRWTKCSTRSKTTGVEVSATNTEEVYCSLSDALKTKESTLGSLPELRLKRNLELIKDNMPGHRSEGLLSRKKVAMGRVNRYELLREERNTTGEDARSERGESEAGEDLYAKFTPRKMKVKSKKKLIIMSVLTGLVLVLLCSTTVFVKQYEEDYVLLVAPASSHEIVELHNHAEISKKRISHASKGMMEVKMGAKLTTRITRRRFRRIIYTRKYDKTKQF